MDITIKASDGRRFNGTIYDDLVKEVNAYESDLKLKKEKEEKERAKAEVERKAKETKQNNMLNAIQNSVDLVNREVEKYEKETGDSLYFVTENGKLKVRMYKTLANGLVKDLFNFWN